MIVLDSSAAVLALLNNGSARTTLANTQIHVPHLIDIELTNALRGLVVGRKVSATDAADALDRWSLLGVTRYPMVGMLRRVWELRDNLSAYDASYVALAEFLGCALLTADKRIGGAPKVDCQVTITPN